MLIHPLKGVGVFSGTMLEWRSSGESKSQMVHLPTLRCRVPDLHPEVRAWPTLTKLMQSHVLSTGRPDPGEWAYSAKPVVCVRIYEYYAQILTKFSGQASAATFSGTSVEHL